MLQDAGGLAVRIGVFKRIEHLNLVTYQEDAAVTTILTVSSDLRRASPLDMGLYVFEGLASNGGFHSLARRQARYHPIALHDALHEQVPIVRCQSHRTIQWHRRRADAGRDRSGSPEFGDCRQLSVIGRDAGIVSARVVTDWQK